MFSLYSLPFTDLAMGKCRCRQGNSQQGFIQELIGILNYPKCLNHILSHSPKFLYCKLSKILDTFYFTNIFSFLITQSCKIQLNYTKFLAGYLRIFLTCLELGVDNTRQDDYERVETWLDWNTPDMSGTWSRLYETEHDERVEPWFIEQT